MSRNIDLSKPLSKSDRQWLETNGDQRRLDENAYLLGKLDITEASTPDNDPGSSPEAVNPSVVAQTQDQAPSADQAALADLTAEQQTPEANAAEPGDNYDDEEAWSYQELVEEYKDRIEGGTEKTVALNASRADIIEALRADDASDN
jgi:hypothetical protein